MPRGARIVVAGLSRTGGPLALAAPLPSWARHRPLRAGAAPSSLSSAERQVSRTLSIAPRVFSHLPAPPARPDSPAPAPAPGATVTDPALVRRAVKAAALGNAMEWF